MTAMSELPWPVWAVLALSLSAGSLALAVWLLIQLPPDYLCIPPKQLPWNLQRIGRNVLGWLVIGFGLLMALPGVPGQGLLTIVCGLLLVDVPGKRRLELWSLAKPSVRDAITVLRHRYAKPPLLSPDDRTPPPADS